MTANTIQGGCRTHRAPAGWGACAIPIMACAFLLAGLACRGSGGSGQPSRPDGNGADMTPAGCYVDGRAYEVGDRFPAPDGCNTCICDESGRVACTEMACRGCDPASEPHHRYVATSADACAVIRFVCEAGTRYFSNQCGCGCEDDTRGAADPGGADRTGAPPGSR